MEHHKKFDIAKEIIWNIVTYGLYFIYCFVMLMFFHLFSYSLFQLNWTLHTVLILAFIVSTIMMAVRITRLISKR